MNIDGVESNVIAAMPAGYGLALNTQQRVVRDELMRLDARLADDELTRQDTKLADMYVGAVHVLHQRGNPDRIAQAAHSLRELIEKLGERLGAPIAGGPSLKERVHLLRQKWPNQALATVYDERMNSLSSPKPVRDFLDKIRDFFDWFDQSFPSRRERIGQFLAATDPLQRRLMPAIEKAHVARWLDVRDALLAIAHHGRNPTETELQQVFDSVDSLLIERLRPKVFEQQDELDQIIAEGEGQFMIREQIIRKALESIKSPVNQDYFFSKLESPEWIEPLRKAGLFSRPEPPTRRADGDYYSRWAGSEYLARMASRAPEMVTKTFENMEAGDNPYVHLDITEAAAGMPSEFAVRLARMETGWVSNQESISGLCARAHGELIRKLAAEKEVVAAIGLFGALFEPLPEPRTLSIGLRESRRRLDRVWYDHVLKEVLPGLIVAAPDSTLKSLCELLDRVVGIERGGEEPTSAIDLSEIWRPAVEDHEQTHGYGTADALVSAVRDVGVQIGAASAERRAFVIELLEKHRWHIFHRIAMHVLCEGGAHALDLARQRILKRDNFDSIAFRHEYARLLRTFFSQLSESDQNHILGWIDEGPPGLAESAESCERETEEAPSEQQRQARSDYWKYKRVHPFRQSLPDSWKRRYVEWSRQFGEPKLATYYGYRWGESSPKTAEELGELAIPELISFLKSWRPSGHWDQPTTNGLAQELRRTVASNAVRFAEDAAAFTDLPPEYISPILDGLREAIRDDTSVSWPAILDLCEWVTRQPRDIPEREGAQYHPLEPHPGWKWVRAAIADLIEHGLRQAEGGIPFKLRDKVWAILAAIAEDPDPSPEEEGEREASYDPFTASLNTTRGKAMHAVVRYAVWVARQLPRPRSSELRLSRGMAEIDEVRTLLDRHLDPSRETSLAVRSVFGHYFPLLAEMDPDWASACRGQVFPPAESAVRLWTAAWNAFVRFNRISTGVFELLSEEYVRAIERCGDYPVENRDLAEAKQGLAEHAMILFGRGTVVIEPDGLIAKFFLTVPVGLQAHAIDFVGRSLAREQAPSTEVIERFMRLWEWLVEAAESAPGGKAERLRLTAFASWFTSRQFDRSWAIGALEDVLLLAGRVDNSYLVIKLLAEGAPQFPNEALNCLRTIIQSDKEGWEISGTQDEVRSILRVALSHSDERVRTEAMSTVHDLGARGFFSFRDLLRSSESEPPNPSSSESAL